MTVDEAERLVVDAEAKLARLETLADADARQAAEAAVAGVLDLYGEAIRRLATALETAAGPAALEAVAAQDELIGHLLLLHDAHPEPAEARVRRALDEVRPYLGSHGGDVELLDVDRGVARVRLQGSCSGCASSTVTLKLAIEEAIARLAPDIGRVVAEEADAASPDGPGGLAGASTGNLISIESLRAGRDPKATGAPIAARASAPVPAWRPLGTVDDVARGPRARDVDGRSLLVLALGGDVYAYDRSCTGCGSSLESATLDGDELTCPTCGHRFDLRRAGRSVADDDGLHLNPVPLLVTEGMVRVAVGSPEAPA